MRIPSSDGGRRGARGFALLDVVDEGSLLSKPVLPPAPPVAKSGHDRLLRKGAGRHAPVKRGGSRRPGPTHAISFSATTRTTGRFRNSPASGQREERSKSAGETLPASSTNGWSYGSGAGFRSLRLPAAP